MARSTFRRVVGIQWEPDPDPTVFEYLIFIADNQSEPDEVEWLAAIDRGEVNPTERVASTTFVIPDGTRSGLDYAVVSHARNEETGEERWSSPYMPEVFDDLPLGEALPDLFGPGEGSIVYAED